MKGINNKRKKSATCTRTRAHTHVRTSLLGNPNPFYGAATVVPLEVGLT